MHVPTDDRQAEFSLESLHFPIHACFEVLVVDAPHVSITARKGNRIEWRNRWQQEDPATRLRQQGEVHGVIRNDLIDGKMVPQSPILTPAHQGASRTLVSGLFALRYWLICERTSKVPAPPTA